MLQNYQFKNQHLVTGLASIYALVSVQNIAHFFIDLDHPKITSWTLGLAIGVSLVFMAHLLSEVNMKDRKAFTGLLSVTMILVILTGLIQGVKYASELGNIGYVLSFVLAATGELVLPLAYSWHKESLDREAITNTGSKIEEITAVALLDVMSDIDLDKAKDKAEKEVQKLLNAHVRHTVTKLMPKDLDNWTTTNVQIDKPNGQNDLTFLDKSVEMSRNEQNSSGQVDIMNHARNDKMSERQTQIVQMANGQNVKDFVQMCADELNFSTRTIKRDLDKLSDEKILYVNGTVERI